MGGRVGAESEVGRGSEFWFTAVMQLGTPAAVPGPRPDRLRDARVLVVDDNHASANALADLLTAWGMRPEVAHDGSGALSILRASVAGRDPVRLAIVDLQMPRFDGFAVAAAVQANRELRQVPLVAMHPVTGAGLDARVHDAGFTAGLTKPVRRAELAAALEAALRSATTPSPTNCVTPGADPLPAPAATPAAGAGVRVLVAEDNPVNQRVAIGMLGKLGIHPVVVENGAQALDALARDAFDLVFMDVQMPQMDGLEAVRALRAPESCGPNRTVPVVALTAHAMQGDRERCLAAGMDDYLAKPVSTQALAAAVRRWCPPSDPPIPT
jgi:CheY-like chemotaxis protein